MIIKDVFVYLLDKWEYIVTFIGGGAILKVWTLRDDKALSELQVEEKKIDLNKKHTDAIEDSNEHWFERTKKLREYIATLGDNINENTEKIIKLQNENINYRSELLEAQSANKRNLGKYKEAMSRMEEDLEQEKIRREESEKHACFIDNCDNRKNHKI